MKLINYCNKIIEFSFYSLFIFVPIVLSQHTSELFELNKIWFTYGATILIAAAWIIKMIAQKNLRIQRTYFDIPILLFLLSQILSTIFSLDQRISFFGYYSRFNGGLLSTLTYIFIYYAFVSNLTLHHAKKALSISLLTGLFVALWGLPAHFGNDPTCLIFRGTLDVSCWTEAFQPTIRIFSTLGQPAWLAAYLAILIPIATAFALLNRKKPNVSESHKSQAIKLTYTFPFSGEHMSYIIWTCLIVLFYIDLLFANTRAGFLGFWIAFIIFWAIVWIKNTNDNKRILVYLLLGGNLLLIAFTILKSFYPLFWFVSIISFLVLLLTLNRKKSIIKFFLVLNIILILLTFLIRSPFPEISEYFSYDGLKNKFTAAPPPIITKTPQGPALEVGGGTESGNIRRIVWEGAINAWQANPILGTGVETFAFAYYKHRPEAHNLTSEWDYLYNKAHNEYLNYLATTGMFGLGSYLLFIASVLFFSGKWLIQNLQKDIPSDRKYMIAALVAAYSSILITNFFGFSVVIVNLYLFLIPAFILFYADAIKPKEDKTDDVLNTFQWFSIIIISIISLYSLFALLRLWNADKAYALGFNLHRVGDYQNAYLKLNEAVSLKPAEPVYKDELAINNATIATALYLQKDAASATQFASQAINLTNEVTTSYPNNVVFWKNRVKVFYLLASAETENKRQFQELSVQSLEKVNELAPTDAKVLYNLGLVYQEIGQNDKTIATLEKAVAKKPNYNDAYYALGLAYRTKAVDKNNSIIDQDAQQKASDAVKKAIELNPNNKEAIKTLQDWEK